MTASLQLTLLGSPQIILDCIPLKKFTHQKSLALLYYLAVTGRPSSRESLAALLWGEATEANARAGLRKSLAELRRRVGGHLLIDRQQVAFNREATYTLDVERFETQIKRCHNRAGADLHPDEADDLAGALTAYQGDFLSGFHIRRAPAFEEWAMMERERLRLDAIRGLHLLTNHYLAQGEYDHALQHVQRLLALEPYQEEAYRQLISLLALNGRREAALAQYQACRQLLHDELGVEPQPETTALYERIREQTAPVPQRQRLPVPLTPLIGRQKEMAALQMRLADPACRLLTLLGPGGYGKTHLALAAGERLAQADSPLFADGVTFVPLQPLRDLAALPAALMHSLEFHFHKESSPVQQLQERLANQRRLLILDNFEHLLAPPQAPPKGGRPEVSPASGGAEGGAGLDILSQLLQVAPHVKIVVTSRVRLNVRGEHILPLNGIAYPDTTKAGATEFPAVHLFIQCAEQLEPTFAPNTADRAAIARICRQVGGSPLGILLTAGWSRLLSPTAIAAQLAADSGEAKPGADFLAAERGDLPARHRSLRAVFNYSWNLLNQSEQTALAGLSLFPNSFGLEAAQAIGGVGLRELGALVDHSLVERTAVNRYYLHEITRQFARQKLRDRTARQVEYGRYYAAQLAHWGAEIKGAGQLNAIQTLDMEIDNARLAWGWMMGPGNLAHSSLAQVNLDQISQALDGLCLYYDWQQRYPEGYAACDELLQWLSDPQTRPDNWNQSEVNRTLSKALVWQTFFAPAAQNTPLLRRALTYLDDPATDPASSRWEWAFYLFQRARIACYAGDMETGLEMYARSIDLYKTLGDRWSLANVSTYLGEALWGVSAYEEAAEVLKKNLSIYQELGDERGMATVMVWLSASLLGQGKLEGERLLGEGLALYDNLGYRVSMTDGFYQAIGALLILGRYAEARALLEEKNAQKKGVGLRQEIAHTLLADTLIFLGEYDAARFHIQIGWELVQRGGDVYLLGVTLVDNGWLALADGAYALACKRFQEAADHCRKHDLKEPLSWAYSFLGFAYWQLDQPKRAAENFALALATATEIESFTGIVFALVSGIPLLAELGSKELALKCYAAVSDYPIVSNARLFDDLVGEWVAEITAVLSPEVVAEAEVYGRKLGLEGMVAEIGEIMSCKL